MIRKAFVFAVAAMAVLVIFGDVREAAAAKCSGICYRITRLVSSEHGDTRRDVRRWIDEMTEAIVEALRQQTSQLSQYDRLQIEAMERLADAQETNEALRLRQEFRASAKAEGRYDPDPNGCLTLERAGYGGTGAPEAGLESNSESARKPPPETPARTEGSVRYAVERQELRKELEGEGISTTDFRDWWDGTTVERSPERNRGTEALIQNVIDPLQPPELNEELKAAPGYRVLDSEMDGVRVRHSIVREAMAYVLGLREGQTTSPGSGGMAIRSGKTMRKFADKGLYLRPLPAGAVSEMQALDVLTTYHHEPQPEEAAQRESSMTARNYMKRIYETQALHARIAYLQLEVSSRQLLVDATRMAGETPRFATITP